MREGEIDGDEGDDDQGSDGVDQGNDQGDEVQQRADEAASRRRAYPCSQVRSRRSWWLCRYSQSPVNDAAAIKSTAA